MGGLTHPTPPRTVTGDLLFTEPPLKRIMVFYLLPKVCNIVPKILNGLTFFDLF